MTEFPQHSGYGAGSSVAANAGGSARAAARTLSVAAMLLPALVGFGATLMINRAMMEYYRQFQPAWGLLLAGVVLLLIAAVLTGAIAAWSSAGPLVTGVLTSLLGFFLILPQGNRFWFDLVGSLGPSASPWLRQAVMGPTYLIVGVLLVAVGLGAAGARRAGARGSAGPAGGSSGPASTGGHDAPAHRLS